LSAAYLIDGEDNRHAAPGDVRQIEIQVSTAVLRANAPRVAYELVERIYLWFGVPIPGIPYVTGPDEGKVVDVEVLRRRGKPLRAQ